MRPPASIFLARCALTAGGHLPNFGAPHGRRTGEVGMKKWVKPRIVEIAIGLEINAYACAEVK
jgi:coenzyme PQQ precursor peptide PqqA